MGTASRKTEVSDDGVGRDLCILYGLWALFIMYIVNPLELFHILIYGRRGARLYRHARRYIPAYTIALAYLISKIRQSPDAIEQILENFRPGEKDVTMIAGADSERLAEDGARAAAWTLLRL